MSTSFQPSLVKSLAVAGIIAAEEMYYFGNTDTRNVLMYASTVGAASYAAAMITSMTAPNINLNLGPITTDGKILEDRLLEVALALAGSSFLHSYYHSGYDFRNSANMPRILGVLVAEVGAEYINDYLNGQALSYLH